MKQKIFTLLLMALAGLTACRKNGIDPDIKQFDQIQIDNYISANGLTGFNRDTTGGDTTGMYYKIMNKGVGAPLEYSDRVSLVFTIKSFDGKYTSSDTILNHQDEYLGHLVNINLPKGLQSAIHNVLKYRDGSMRLLIPSHLAYGRNGFGSGSISNANSRIAGNQCLDYYVHVINDQQVYDDLVIQNYLKANNLSGYTKTATGLYYKIITPGTGIDVISDLSTISTTYVGSLLNGTNFDATAQTTATSFTVGGLVSGVKEGLEKYAVAGTSISLFVPSRLAYAISPPTGSNIPTHSVLRFEFQIATVTN